MPLVVMCMALFLFACYRETTPEGPTSGLEAPAEEPRVRIALTEAAPAVKLTQLLGSWKLEGQAGDQTLGVALFGPLQLVIETFQGRLVAHDGSETHSFPGATELRLVALPSAADDPVDPVFEFEGRTYRGDLRVRTRADGMLQLINSIGIEAYLPCVIGHEMPISWSDSALHAQAIAARTYALATLKPHADYDLFADTRSQVYRGVIAEDAKARRIVEETRGMVVTWNGDLIVTYFHSTCGGDTVPASWIFSWVKEDTAPLMGAGDCTCQPSKYYRWSQTVDLRQTPNELVLELPLRSVTVDHWPRGQYVKQVHFTDAGGEVTTANGWDTRRIFGLKGYAFDVAVGDGGHTLEFEGRGWGHGVGMCQFGAEGYSKQGWTGKQILEHFYPSAQVESLGY
jgi:stage II sporulation protein D